jgi:hypothetical protein
LFYVISPGGEVVRHFTVDVEGKVLSMHLSGHRIALVTQNEGETRSDTVSVFDLEGKPIATYDDYPKDWHDRLGITLACYTDNPEQFIFLGTTDDGFLQFKMAEPR